MSLPYYKALLRKSKNCLFLAGLAWISCANAAWTAPPPHVVVSITPLYSLATGVMEGIATPQLLMNGAASPHSFSLRPSQRRALAEADLVFLVGPGLEPFLEKPLTTLKPGAHAIIMETISGLTLYPYRTPHHHDEDDHHEHEEVHDPHFWLDPSNAKLMVEAMAATLEEKDPSHTVLYQKNAKTLIAKLGVLDKEITQTISDVEKKENVIPYFTAHDAYQYFERRYGLPASQPLTLHPELGMSAVMLRDIQGRLSDKRLACIFSEPGNQTMVKRLAQQTGAQIHLLNPEGIGYPADGDAYFKLLRQIARTYADCLHDTRLSP